MTDSDIKNVEEDFLDEDRPINGQKYVCLSFVSPDNLILDKKDYSFYKYLKKNHDYKKSEKEFKEEFKYFVEDNEQEIQDEFDEKVDFKTNVRGVKVRGVYDNIRAANIRAKVLQKLDRTFHVYVGQVGYWLPWDPTANSIEEQEYLEPELNNLVKEYNRNKNKKEMYFEERKQEQRKKALEEADKNKKKNLALKEQNVNKEEKEEIKEEIEEIKEDVEELKEIEDDVEEIKDKITEGISDNLSVNVEDIKDNLQDIDPWMERKMNENSD